MLPMLLLGCATITAHPIHYADAEDVADAIDAVRKRRAVRAVYPDARTNTVFVRATSKGTGQVQELISSLDVAVHTPATSGISVFYLVHHNAAELAAVLRKVLRMDEVFIAADAFTNSITCAGDCRKAERLIKLLDVSPDAAAPEGAAVTEIP